MQKCVFMSMHRSTYEDLDVDSLTKRNRCQGEEGGPLGWGAQCSDGLMRKVVKMHGSPGKIHALILGQTTLPGNFVLFHTGKMHVHYNSVLRVFPSKCLAKASICLKVAIIYTTASRPSIEGRVCQPRAVGICLPDCPGHWGR